MNQNPRISVLMSVKNGLPYLEETIASIRRQTVTDFEFVIVDNASTDGSARYVESMRKADARIVLIENSVDLGHSGGLNRGLAACRGEWIARMDADDLALPNRFERQLAFVAENPDVKATSCLAHYIDPQGRRVGKTDGEPTTRDDFQRMLKQNLPFGLLHSGAWVDRKVLVELGGYRPEFEAANDIDLWCRLSDRHLLLVQPEYLMEYRIHGSSLSAQRYERGRLKHLWARDCMVARRSGLPEPGWAEFLELRRQAPGWLRVNRWRKTQAKRWYRQSAEHHVTGQHLRSFFEMGMAAILQPEYTLPRLRVQKAHANRH